MNQAVDCDLFIIQLQIDTSYYLIPQFRGNLVGGNVPAYSCEGLGLYTILLC